MKVLVSILLLSFGFISFGQKVTENELIGIWEVVSIKGDLTNLPTKQQDIMDNLKKAFQNSTFEFMKDKNFNFNIDYVELGMMMKNVHWKLNSIDSRIWIQEWKDKERKDSGLMEIIISRQEGKIFFMLSESPFILEVNRK